MIKLIVAVTSNGFIGKDNGLIVHNKYDMTMFKKLTTGHSVVMGRKTLKSMGNKPLKNRDNYVLTRSDNPESISGINYVTHDEMLAIQQQNKDKVFWVIGGSDIYDLYLRGEVRAQELHVSHFPEELEGDTKFPVEELAKLGYVEKANLDMPGFVYKIYQLEE